MLSLFLAVTLSGAVGQNAAWYPSKYKGPLPLHPSAEFFIASNSTGDERVGRPSSRFFAKRPYTVYLGPMMSFDPQFPTAQFDLTGSDAKGDRYTVSFQADGTSEVQKKEIAYSGSVVEVFKDGNFTVGIRPAKENK